MVLVIRVQKGGFAPVLVPFRKVAEDDTDGQLTSPNGATITILNPDGTTLVAETGMNWVEVGTFLYHWNTGLIAVGDYLAKIRFGQAFSSASNGATIIGERDVILRVVGVL